MIVRRKKKKKMYISVRELLLISSQYVHACVCVCVCIDRRPWMEVLFALGYRPGLLTDVKRRIKTRVEIMDAGKNE